MHANIFKYVQSKPSILYVKHKQPKPCNKWMFTLSTRLLNILNWNAKYA